MAKRKKKTKSQAAERKRKAGPRSRSTPVAIDAEAAAKGDVAWLGVIGAKQNNLRSLDVRFPLQRFVCVTGVSGSGKSSLVNDILRETLSRDLNGAVKVSPGEHERIDGLDYLDKIIDIDQSPIGRTPRSNPATYIKVFDAIRSLYTRLPDAKVRGYKPGRFSFNVKTGATGGGRCEACEGNGANRMEMDFLADVWVTCPVCGGHRFNRETLQILYKGKTIADVLEMDVQEALTHFENVPKIAHMLQTLHDVGLDYVKLGQSSTTLSGGEAQRIKLARELVKKSTGHTLYVLDEPTTGLHFDDIRKLLDVLHGFVDAGNTVLVIEHNLDVIKTADWVIDLGPEGGPGGGRIVAEGPPERIAKSRKSYTGAALRELLDGVPAAYAASVSEVSGAGSARGSGKNRRKRKASAKKNGSPVIGDAQFLRVVGAEQHNLKNITVDVPRGQMTVCSGPSGSGKSSFAIDTVYTEGQRRYVESLSAYARQFIGQLQPPKVERVEGLSPSVCIEQKNTSKSPRSTVGTVTEIYDYMRILWARIGQPYCPRCDLPIGTQSSDEIVERVLALDEGQKIFILAPVERSAQESYADLFTRERANGYARVRVDGMVYSLDDDIPIDNRRHHDVELVVDRAIVRQRQASRITDSIEQALSVGQGVMLVQPVDDAATQASESGGRQRTKAKSKSAKKPAALRFSQHHACDNCGESFDELTPHHFSFNSRLGWCEACEGLGIQHGANPSAIIVHPTRTMLDGALAGWENLTPDNPLYTIAVALADHVGFDPNRPWHDLTESQQQAILHGCDDEWIEAKVPQRATKRKNRKSGSESVAEQGLRFRWRGFYPAISRATRSSWQYRKRLEELVTEVPCEACTGSRLRPEAHAARLQDATIFDVCSWPLGKALRWFEKLKLDGRERRIAGELMHEIISRLRFLVEVGLDYVTLHRRSATLSGGEAQRIQLASQIGTGLTGVLYVLDEPTIGLHPRDNTRLNKALHRLRDLGNTLMVVEHDREIIEAADHVLDFGPGAGRFGGEITAEASPAKLQRKRDSLTGQYLAGRQYVAVPANRRPVDQVEHWLTVIGARENNLKEVDAAFPLSRFTCVTGVSGSGKSSLVTAILYPALASRIHRASVLVGGHQDIQGIDQVDKVINVDQSPIGNSPSSNAATYTGLFDEIRELFAKLPESKIRGYAPGRFSFNRPGGRCESCEGMGQVCIEMHFLPDVWVTCDNCQGARYVPETLDVRYRGKHIADLLSMSASEALELFQAVPRIRRWLQTLEDVGLGYLQLGQSANKLSGGEAQRVKLASELGRPSTGKTLYILDEPTTGLHFDDLKKLLSVLHRLVDLGNTVICIEHNLDVIKTADWLIDLGPEAGDRGGTIVFEGTPEDLIDVKASHTGRCLKPVLQAGPLEERTVVDAQAVAEQSIKEATTRIDLGDEVKMPWQVNGRKWHTVDKKSRHGEPVNWDADMLIWLVETIENISGFEPANWNDRASIELKAPGKVPWLVHFLTGNRELVAAYFRVPAGSITPRDAMQLNVVPLDDRNDLPIYSAEQRVVIRERSADWDTVRMTLRDFIDVDKAKFRAFLKKAAKAYLDKLARTEESPGEAEPWKTSPETYHFSQQAISHKNKSKVRWQPALLPAMIGQLKKIQPDLKLEYGRKIGIGLKVPGESAPAGMIVTNRPQGLRFYLRTPPGVLTTTQVEPLGLDSEIRNQAAYDQVLFWVRSLDNCNMRHLAEIWRSIRDAHEGNSGTRRKRATA